MSRAHTLSNGHSWLWASSVYWANPVPGAVGSNCNYHPHNRSSSKTSGLTCMRLLHFRCTLLEISSSILTLQAQDKTPETSTPIARTFSQTRLELGTQIQKKGSFQNCRSFGATVVIQTFLCQVHSTLRRQCTAVLTRQICRIACNAPQIRFAERLLLGRLPYSWLKI